MRTPFFIDGQTSLWHGDNSRVLMDELRDEKFDLILTSPPYDAMRTYGGHGYNFKACANAAHMSLKDGGVLVWIVGDQTVDGTESGTSFRHALYFMECGLNLHDTMIFEKHNFSNPSLNRYHQMFEYMFVFSNGTPKTFNPIKDKPNKYREVWGRNTFRKEDGSKGERPRNEYREMGMRGNIWRYLVGNMSGDDTFDHPAPFPEDLAKDHILTWTNPGDAVLDPHAGRGTVLKMARELGRKAVGIEINEPYCLNIAKRLAQKVLL